MFFIFQSNKIRFKIFQNKNDFWEFLETSQDEIYRLNGRLLLGQVFGFVTHFYSKTLLSFIVEIVLNSLSRFFNH
jgi:hypothetical protein